MKFFKEINNFIKDKLNLLKYLKLSTEFIKTFAEISIPIV